MVRSLFRRVRRRLQIIRRFEWNAYWRRRPVRPRTVLYESFSGNGMLCNPEAVFRALRQSDDMRDLEHVWVLSDFRQYRETIAEFAHDRTVRFVRYDSPAYYRALATCQYLVNNSTFPAQFSKREGQVYLNTWHGTPLKRMGYHIPHGGPDTRNIVRNFLHADYLLSGSEFMTREMYEEGYKLRGVFRGRIIQEGSPRVDRQCLSSDDATALRASLARRGVAVDGRRILLYAPTWRGASFHDPDDDMTQLRDRIDALTARLDPGWRVLLKVHQQVYRFAVADPALRDVLVPNDLPTNAVLGISDVLVTDYSSIFYDFLATGRPVFFYVPDLDDYADSRGLYEPPTQWPGPVTASLETLAEYVNGLGAGGDVPRSHEHRYRAARDQYCPRDDGDVAQRVIDIVFRGRTGGWGAAGRERAYDIRSDLADGRESILIYLGGLRPNGINSSALNLLDNIDHARFDVSVLYSYHSRSPHRLASEAAINPNVRLFPRIGGFNGSKRHTMGRRALVSTGADSRWVDLPAQRRIFADEWRRCFGTASFDYIVDFSGYSPMWAFLLQQGTARSHSVWLHNDMDSDRQKVVAGQRTQERGLGALFTLYRYFDRLVSVSPALAEVNERALAPVSGDAAFTSALNTINHERVLRMASDAHVGETVAEAERAARTLAVAPGATSGAGTGTGPA
ncbi:MAG: CDP-glycerol glycerophosphotransferase family protein, partial [Actinocatenispora sp.]